MYPFSEGALCILASKEDLRNGAKHNPELYQELVYMEHESGWTFRTDLALANLFERDEQELQFEIVDDYDQASLPCS